MSDEAVVVGVAQLVHVVCKRHNETIGAISAWVDERRRALHPVHLELQRPITPGEDGWAEHEELLDVGLPPSERHTTHRTELRLVQAETVEMWCSICHRDIPINVRLLRNAANDEIFASKRPTKIRLLRV